MKKLFFVIVALLGLSTVQAQHQIKSFFDDMGLVRIETQELAESADTLVTVFHRADDIVWSRVVYRIVDMRFKQNYQLYTPQSNDPVYNSLLKVMLMAVADSMPVYAKDDNGDLRPFFNADTKRVGAEVFSLLDVYNLMLMKRLEHMSVSCDWIQHRMWNFMLVHSHDLQRIN